MLSLPHHEDSTEWRSFCFTLLKMVRKRLCNVLIYFVNVQPTSLPINDLKYKFDNLLHIQGGGGSKGERWVCLEWGGVGGENADTVLEQQIK